jgi:hypothetical protein
MRRVLYLLTATLVVAVPAIMASALLWHFFHASIFDLVPVQSDEIMYWHQANTFAEAGFNGGYYTTGDVLPRIGRYFSWGVAAPVFYGTLGAIFDWPLWGIAVVNLVILTLAIVAFIAFVRPMWLELLVLGIVLALYHPIVLYAPTQYVEIFLMAVALTLSALFARIIAQRQAGKHPSRSIVIAAGILIFAAALFRLPWSGLFLPLTILAFNPLNIRQAVGATGAAIALAIPPFLIYTLMAAPYPNYTISRILERPALARAARIFANNIKANWRQIFEGDPLEIQMRVGIAALCIVLTVVLIAWLTHQSIKASKHQSIKASKHQRSYYRGSSSHRFLVLC